MGDFLLHKEKGKIIRHAEIRATLLYLPLYPSSFLASTLSSTFPYLKKGLFFPLRN